MVFCSTICWSYIISAACGPAFALTIFDQQIVLDAAVCSIPKRTLFLEIVVVLGVFQNRKTINHILLQWQNNSLSMALLKSILSLY